MRAFSCRFVNRTRCPVQSMVRVEKNVNGLKTATCDSFQFSRSRSAIQFNVKFASYGYGSLVGQGSFMGLRVPGEVYTAGARMSKRGSKLDGSTHEGRRCSRSPFVPGKECLRRMTERRSCVVGSSRRLDGDYNKDVAGDYHGRLKCEKVRVMI